MKKIVPIILFIIMMCFNGFCQEKTAEQAYLETSKAIARVVSQIAKGTSMEAKQEALNQLEAKIDQFKPTDKEIIDLLEYLGGQGTINRTVVQGKANDYVDIRAKSLNMLGKIGGDYARTSISRIVSAERSGRTGGDTAVFSAAYYALASVGDDSDYNASKTIINSFKRLNDKKARENAIFALIESLEKLSDKKPLPVIASLGYLETLNELINEDSAYNVHTPRVRKRAKKCISKILINAI